MHASDIATIAPAEECMHTHDALSTAEGPRLDIQTPMAAVASTAAWGQPAPTWRPRAPATPALATTATPALPRRTKPRPAQVSFAHRL
jgi:hypothetical protein